MLKKAVTLGGISVVVAVLTYLQSRLLVQALGAGALLDAYYLATTLPMAASTVAGVVLVALIVPVYSRELRDAGTLSGVWRTGLVVAGGLAFLQAAAAAASIALSFWDAQMLADPAWLGLILLGSALYGVAHYGNAVLMCTNRPEWYAYGQIMSVVAFSVVLLSGVGRTMFGLGVLFVVGALGMAATTAAGSFVAVRGISTRPAWPASLAGSIKKGFAPAALSVAMMQSAVAIDRVFARSWGEGTVTALFMADRIAQIVLSMLATSLAVVIFPGMSARSQQSSELIGRSAIASAVMLAPISALLWVHASDLIGVLFAGGSFQADAVELTSSFLRLLATGLVPMGLMLILPKRLQGVGAYWGHALFVVTLLVLGIAAKLAFQNVWGATGIGAGTSLSYWVVSLTYVRHLVRRGLIVFERVDLRDVSVTLAVSLGYAAVMSVSGVDTSGGVLRWAFPALALLVMYAAAAIAGVRAPRLIVRAVSDRMRRS